MSRVCVWNLPEWGWQSRRDMTRIRTSKSDIQHWHRRSAELLSLYSQKPQMLKQRYLISR